MHYHLHSAARVYFALTLRLRFWLVKHSHIRIWTVYNLYFQRILRYYYIYCVWNSPSFIPKSNDTVKTIWKCYYEPRYRPQVYGLSNGGNFLNRHSHQPPNGAFRNSTNVPWTTTIKAHINFTWLASRAMKTDGCACQQMWRGTKMLCRWKEQSKSL